MPSAKKRTPIVPAKVKVAIGILLDQPHEDLHAAALAAGLTVYRLRESLKRGFVRKYLQDEKQALLESVSAGNPLALKRVRDSSPNGMAIVASVKAIEQMKQETQQAAGGSPFATQQPGFVIVIKGGDGEAPRVIAPMAPPPMIEHQPAAEREPVER
jgi:hypothetical protein